MKTREQKRTEVQEGVGVATTREQQITLNRNRGLIYSFLAKMYEREITLELLKELTGENSPILRAAALMELDDEGFKEGFNMLSKYLRSASKRDLNQVKLELAVEYANLFLGVKKKPPHPSESVYRSEYQSMYQESRTQVMQMYWKAGVDKVKQFTEPEDHIAIELQFMEYLCERTVQALEKNDNEEAAKFLQFQKEFVNDHLSKWIPQLTKDIIEAGEIDFYKGVAYLTKSFVELEKGSVNAMNLLLETKK